MDDTNTTIFALKAHISTSMHSVSHSNGTHAKPPTLAEFITAQSADEFFQNVAKELCRARTEFKVNKEEVLVGRAPIDEAQQNIILHIITTTLP